MLGNVGVKLADRAVLPIAAPGETSGEELIEAEEETAPRDTLPNPELPSQSEIDDHNVDHCPYRSWCRHCVEGRARELTHKLQDKSARKIATISLITSSSRGGMPSPVMSGRLRSRTSRFSRYWLYAIPSHRRRLHMVCQLRASTTKVSSCVALPMMLLGWAILV